MKIKLFNILTAGLLFLTPTVNFAQAPTLGTTADFVLFSSVGAVTNSGITYLTKLTGHVGANSGAISGFGNVDGNMYAGGPQSALCATDLLIAYNQLNATVPTFFPAPLLGNGQILAAGVYSISAPATLNLNLILDGGGNPNAVFVFQIQGAFSANANSKVKLINGTKACNVFWKVEGLVSLAANVLMRGTVIANNAAINMSAGDTLEGRALAINGAVTVTQLLGYTPIGCGSPLLTGPAAPALASTACYAIFSSNGAVNNVGVTTVTGDIGSNLGSALGYNPLFVVGTIHTIPDISTAACATDLGNVYTYLNTLPNDILLLYPAQFGNNLVLTPHTYLMNGATMLTDSVFLNAEGNANAVFVIQINGALNTTASSKVVLINGAQSKNVFWKVDGAVTISAGSIFRGTIVCNNAAVNLNTGVFLDGRALTTNGALSTSAVTVTIPTSINVISQPTDQVACAGSSVSFTVGAGGATYQWRKGLVNLINGGNISGANTATLTINPVGLPDVANNYNVVITGACASNFTSVNVSLTLGSTSITSQPSNQNGCPGSSISFTTSATGAGLTYQWRKGIVNLINGGNISGATSATLTFNPVAISDVANNYNVIVGGACAPNATSTNVSLVLNNPSITSEPSNQSACPGNSVSFTTAATGPGLNYQWRKGIVNLINGGNISGATTATLTINPVGLPDVSNNYNVIVTGACAPNDTSINVSLIINGANITSQPSNQTACPGGAANFTTAATGAGLTYQWRKGIANLINGGNISGATTATLTINPVSVSDVANNYNVVITGACAPNATSTNVSLTISTLSITSQPSNQTTCPGSSISFSVAATGGGLTYQWRKGISNLINGGNISGATTATLTINPVNVSDAAINYNVVISGTCVPNDTSNMVSLTVNPTPIAIVSNNSSGCLGSPINLSAQTVAGGIYNWTGPNSYTSSAQNPIILNSTLLNAGTYSLNITMGGCVSNPTTVVVTLNICTADLSVIKTVNNPQPVIGQTIVFSIIAKNNGPANATGVSVTEILQSGYTYVSSSATMGTYNNVSGIWNIGTLNNGASALLNITAIVNAKGNYVNTVMISSNAVDTNSINDVSVIETFPTDFFIPEGFSPNGDGINDLFVIRGINNFTENKFVVFNRWGDKVLETNNYQNTWNGKTTIGLRIGGDELPVGTYFYLLDLNNGTPVYKGTIYLNR